MKTLYLTTAIVTLLSATGAYAQTVTGLGVNGVSADGIGQSATGSGVDGAASGSATSGVTGESAIADASGAGGDASATVGDGVIVDTRGNGVGGPNIAQVGVVSGGPSNNQIQFQLGNNNTAINAQVGTYQGAGW